MGTSKYDLPLITGTASAKVPRDFNALATAVDDVLYKNLNEVDTRLTSRLAQKVTKGNGEILLTDLHTEVKTAMTGGSVPVVGEGAVRRENIVNGEITFDKFHSTGAVPITTSRKNKNLLNKNNVNLNKVVSAGTGLLVDGSGFDASEFIEILPSVQYTISHIEQSAFYDSAKSFISGITTSGLTPHTPHTFTTPVNAKFIRVTVKHSILESYQLELGSASTSYEKYGAYLRVGDIDPTLYDDLYFPTKSRIVGGIYQPTKLPNLFNKNTAVKGQYVSAGNGALAANAVYYASDYIEIIGGTSYWNSNIEQTAFYDKNKVFISGITTAQAGGANIPYTFVAPSNAKYIRISLRDSYINSFVFAEGSTAVTETRYGYQIPLGDIESSSGIPLTNGSGQLFNKNTAVQGYYANAGNGGLSANAGYYASDYITVNPNTQYTVSHLEQIAYYDSNKTFISGQSTSGLTANAEYTVTTPVNAKFMRVSLNKTYIDIYKLEKGKLRKSYESFSNLLSNQVYTPIQKITSMLVNAPSTVNVKLIGDSITQGMGGTGYAQDGATIVDSWKINTSGHCWANSLKNYLESKFNCAVTNYGMSGIGSEGVQARLASLISPTDDIIVLMLGTNDRANPKYKLERFMNLIISYIKGLGKEVIIMSSIPASITNEQTANFVIHMEDVDHTIMRVANNWKMEYVSVYKLFMEYCDSRNLTIDSLLADGLHPNNTGYDIMFYLISNALGFGTKRPGATW